MNKGLDQFASVVEKVVALREGVHRVVLAELHLSYMFE
jgi:hypothetical protein